MCQKKLPREPRNEGLLLLLLAGVLLLSSSSPPGFSVLPGCEARLLPVDGSLLGRGGTRDEGGEGNSLIRRMVLNNGSDGKAKHTAPSSSPSPSPSLSSAPASTPHDGTVSGTRESGTPSVDVQRDDSSLLWLFIAGPAVFVMVLTVVVAAKIWLVVKKKRRPKAVTSWMRGVSFRENQQLEKYTFAGVPTITFEELEAACEEFTNVIGTSTDCKVFKGTRVSDGLQIAVTRMLIPAHKWTAKREIGFRHKVEDLTRMNHENMVNLVAYCATDIPFERMLVFEYASNGTLYEHLHPDPNSNGLAEDQLDWATRMRIVMGAACGLEYLHHKLVPPTSHFKFTARHVFLTEEYAAKLADFAVSPDSVEKMDVRSLGRRESFARIANGLHADWEGHRHTPNLESNIRSFGVFLLEVITGRRPITHTQGPLIHWAKEYLHDPKKMRYLVDPSVKDYKKGELEVVCDVVRMCVFPNGNKLPTMNELADILSKELGITREAANRIPSPLLWAEMELLASMDHSLGDFPLTNSPKHRSLNSQDSGNKLNSPFSHVPTESHNDSSDSEQRLEIVTNSPVPKLLTKLLTSSHSSNRTWASNPSGLELLSPQDDYTGFGEDQEAPLAPSINSSVTQHHPYIGQELLT